MICAIITTIIETFFVRALMFLVCLIAISVMFTMVVPVAPVPLTVLIVRQRCGGGGTGQYSRNKQLFQHPLTLIVAAIDESDETPLA